MWLKCLGGSGYDDSWSVWQTYDGRYITAGLTRSNDGDVSGNHGNGDALIVKIDAPPSTPDKPSGPRSGRIRKVYVYSTSATDPEGDLIKYTFDWFKPGKYRVKVMATDSIGASSEWSKALTVTEASAVARVAG